jgi:hypothetical protein
MSDSAGRRDAAASKRKKSGSFGRNLSELDPNYPDN